MPIVGVNLEAIDSYFCKDDTEPKTEWKLGTLSTRVLGILMDQSAAFTASVGDSASMKAEFKGNQAAYEITQLGLRGWSNFQLPDGSQIPFETIEKTLRGTNIKQPAVPDALMELIPLSVLQELSGELEKRNRPTAAEGKSSGE